MDQQHLALVGAGYWGKNLARNFLAINSLHTLCDPNQHVLESYGTEYDKVKKTTELDSIWKNPEIASIAIAAPAVLHFSIAKAALFAGKDVYVEKPLCLVAEEAEELISLAEGRQRILMVGHLLQYHPHVQHLQQIVAEGRLGTIHYISSNRLNLGKIRREENALWSFAPHDISVILSLLGNALPETVICTGGSYVTHDVADTTLSALHFASGARAHVYVSWLNPFKEQKLTVVGDRGMAVFDDTRPWHEKLALYYEYLERNGDQAPVPNRVRADFPQIPDVEPLRAECQHFLDCCLTRTAPRTDGAEGLRVLRVLQAAQASLEAHGQRISVLQT